MRIAEYIAGIALMTMLAAPVAAQAPTPKRRAPSRPAATRVIVRDVSGTPLEGVNVTITGPARHQATTDAQGVAQVVLATGTYRLRFELEGFITLEREVTIRSGQPASVEVALGAAPRPPAPPPPPAPEPPPPPPPVPPGRPVNLSILKFLDKNFVGRDPYKETLLGCAPAATTRLLQLRDPLAAHTHADVDEILYVVAGEGVLRIEEEMTPVSSTSVSVIPRGLSHALQRQGRNPLIVLSMLAGAPCGAPPGRVQ